MIDALFLAQSLGFSCHLNDVKSQWTHTFKDGTTEKAKEAFLKVLQLEPNGEFGEKAMTFMKMMD